MRKWKFVLILLFVVQGLLFAKEDYSDFKINFLEYTSFVKEYKELYRIPLKEKVVSVWGKYDSKKKCYLDDKLLVAFQGDRYLDGMVIGMSDTMADYQSYITDSEFCVKVKISYGKYIHTIVYFDENQTQFSIYGMTGPFLADLEISSRYIFYVIECDDDTIRRIDKNTAEEFAYKGYYPCVGLYKQNDDLLYFKYNKKWYEVANDKITPSEKVYEPKQKLRYTNFAVK